MATTHHPAPTHVGFGHHNEWLWITLGAIAVALVAAGISWAIWRPEATTTAAPTATAGFEYVHEVTPAHLRAEGVTASFVGVSGDLTTVIAPVRGFDIDHEVTTVHAPSTTPVTGEYFGNSGVLFPEINVSGFELDDDMTSLHMPPDAGVTSPYVGSSG